MSPTEILARLRAIPGGVSPEALGAVAKEARVLRLPADQTIFRPEDQALSFILLLSGQVRVETTAPGGRSAVLYRLAPGDSCVMTTSCLLSGRAYGATAVSETDIEAVSVDKSVFFNLLSSTPAFRQLVFDAYSDRLADLTNLIEELLLKRIDGRLALLLAAQAPSMNATHEFLAHELGAAREAVSRILKDFERRGWVSLNRGKIDISSPDELRRFAEAVGARDRTRLLPST
ncbi:MAG: Crp/Fnr family transcriptional regulator [Neomegalonema sp.]|nr:Crp/Fnr family transcriptional regulator [Neomegalonema sp.]